MAKTPEFKYAPMFQLGKDTTEYRLLTKEGVSTAEFEGKTILKVSKEALTLLAQQAFHDGRNRSCLLNRRPWQPSQSDIRRPLLPRCRSVQAGCSVY